MRVPQGLRAPSTNPAPISVLIVDDSAVARAALSRIVESCPDLVVAATVTGAAQAIAYLADHPVDVVLLDLHMPGRDGLEALPDLLIAGRGAHVLVVSSSAAAGAEATLRALALGAADTLLKPSASAINQSFGAVLIDRVFRLGAARANHARPSRFELRAQQTGPVELLAIGASTGGIKALATFFEHLPAGFDAPIAVTQHLPAAFIPYFANQVATMAQRPTRVVDSAQLAERGNVFIAPGNAHLTIHKVDGKLAFGLSDAPVASRCRPSVDPMLASAGEVLGEGALGVVLTGMGRDGAEGAGTLVAAGGSVVAQDEASSIVWGMPGAVAKAGLASLVTTPQRLAAHAGTRGSA